MILFPRNLFPKEFLNLSPAKILKGKKILIARAAKARDVLPEGLKKLGAQVDVVTAYETVSSGKKKNELEELFKENQVDVITFTSSSTVNNFVKIMGRNFSLPEGVKIACIGPVTAAAAKKAGFPVDIHQEEYTMEGLVGALIDYFQEKTGGTKKRQKQMIGISKLYCGAVEPSDVLRYNRQSGQLPSHLLQFSADKKPVVVWNMTRRCNLKCIHCYSNSADIDYPDELTTEEGKKLIDDLAAFGSPVILFSGGEPLIRKDLLELAQYATDKGMRAVISTNGTLITKEIAAKLQKIGLSYVGVSLDGLEKTHDRFPGKEGRVCRGHRRNPQLPRRGNQSRHPFYRQQT